MHHRSRNHASQRPSGLFQLVRMAQPNRNQSSNGTEAVHTPADTSQPLNISQYSRQVAVPSHAFQPWNMQWNWFWPSP